MKTFKVRRWISVSLVLGERHFRVQRNDFAMNGKPFCFISRSLHHHENTGGMMADECFKAIQSYIAWNLHSKRYL
jgi:hypothetical protein